MLDREHALVRRDTELPGLHVLLDTDAFLSRVRSALPQLEATDVRATYLRYKPTTSCLAGFEIMTPDGWMGTYAKAFRHDAADKLRKASVRAADAQCPFALLDHDSIVVCPFPLDLALPSLVPLQVEEARHTMLEKLLGSDAVSPGALHTIHHRPERRYVARLDGHRRRLTLKMHRRGAFEHARANVRAVSASHEVRTPALVGRSRRHGIVALQWLEGENLAHAFTAGDVDAAVVHGVGDALRSLHALDIELPYRERATDTATIRALSTSLQMLLPDRAPFIDTLARRLATWVDGRPTVRRPIHGDFHAGQVVLTADGVAFIDLDEAVLGDPIADLGAFMAEREYAALAEGSPVSALDGVLASLLAGYGDERGLLEGVNVHTALALFARALHPFRNRDPVWPQRIGALLVRCAEHLDVPHRVTRAVSTCGVEVEPGVHADVAIRSLRAALDPVVVRRALGEMFADRGEPPPQLRRIVVWRHKPGRRCLVAYECEPNGDTRELTTILGKVRAKGADERTHSLQRFLWRNGFGPTSDDGVYVPEPLGIAPALGMWCQRQVPGSCDIELLGGSLGATVASRIADAIFKLHRSSVAVTRVHTAADEIAILTKRLRSLADARPHWTSRLEALLRGCRDLYASFDVPQTRPIHRDFYHDQVLVHGSDVYLIDLDLCARGDPGLDVGNFVAHLVEAALRIDGDPRALDGPANVFVERYVVLAGEGVRRSIEAHVTIALARHVSISSSMRDREHCSERLLALTEERLA